MTAEELNKNYPLPPEFRWASPSIQWIGVIHNDHNWYVCWVPLNRKGVNGLLDYFKDAVYFEDENRMDKDAIRTVRFPGATRADLFRAIHNLALIGALEDYVKKE